MNINCGIYSIKYDVLAVTMKLFNLKSVTVLVYDCWFIKRRIMYISKKISCLNNITNAHILLVRFADHTYILHIMICSCDDLAKSYNYKCLPYRYNIKGIFGGPSTSSL